MQRHGESIQLRQEDLSGAADGRPHTVEAPKYEDGSSDRQPGRWQFWLLTLIALFTLVTVVMVIIFSLFNQQMRAEVSQRQRIINEGIRFSRLNSQLIQTLAETSARTGDAALSELLASQGIGFSIKPASSNETSAINGGQGKQ